MFAPALYLGDDVKREVVSQNDASSVVETNPLLDNGATSDWEINHEFPTHVQLSRSRGVILLISLGAYFLLQIARDSTNYLTTWVALRFHETMAQVCIGPCKKCELTTQ